MKYNKAAIILFAGLGASFAANSADWQLVWDDEFTDSVGSSWNFATGNGTSGWGNNELEYYLADNASVEDGNLVITAKKESTGGYSYTSARMNTLGNQSFKYGKIEARIKLPTGTGLWPAFWMLGTNMDTVGWPYCGEIDIMERINTENVVYGTVHWWANLHASYSGTSATLDMSQYHVYTVEWDASMMKWYVDGVLFHEMSILNNTGDTDEFHNEFYLLLNLAVGGDWPGTTVDESVLPAKMYVDYVRVYQDTTNTASSHTGSADSDMFSQQIEAENYSNMSGVATETTTDMDAGSDVSSFDTGDWVVYNNVTIPTSGEYQIEYRVASTNSAARLSLDYNAGANVVGYVDLGSTGGSQTWQTVTQQVTLDAGSYNFGIYAQTGGFSLNWMRITKL